METDHDLQQLKSRTSAASTMEDKTARGIPAPTYGNRNNGANPPSPRPQSSSNVPDTKVTLPEKLGPTQKGPIAVKSEGDKNAFSPNDVRQGAIGDCYFLASLMAVAKTNPKLLQNAIKDNGDGTYTVKLYKEEQKKKFFGGTKSVMKAQNMIIYPTFPLGAAGTDTANPSAGSLPGHAYNAEGEDKELWVRLIEKAYAIMMGSYAKIGGGGLIQDGLRALTGDLHKEKVIGARSHKKVKKRMINGHEEGVPMGASSIDISKASAEAKKFAQDNSIVQPHAYSIVSASEDKVKVRNPHNQRDVEKGVLGARVAEPEMTWTIFFELFQQYTHL